MAMLVGVTGGIGSGKSTICKALNAMGILSYDADSRAKWLMNHNPSLVQDIIKTFGDESYVNGQLNTSFLSQVVFSNPPQLDKLNHLVHPAVEKDFQAWTEKHQEEEILIKEAALLVETGSYKDLDKLIVVDSPIALRIKRIKKRDPNRSEEEIQNIIKRQLSIEEKLKVADFVIQNNEKDSIISQLLTIRQRMM